MNLVIAKAFIDEVKNRGEDPGEKILGIDIKFTADVKPGDLDELSTEIRPRLFDASGAPTITELGRCHWRTEYEKGDMNIAGHKVPNTGLLNITLEPMLKGDVELKGWARVSTTDEGLAGALAMLIKQTVKITFKKMTQVPLIKTGDAPDDDEADGKKKDGQGDLQITPLLTEEALNERAKTKH